MNSPQAMDSFMNSAATQEAAVVSATGSLPPHLVKIPGEQWAFWRWICLRGAGFPFDLPQQLAAPKELMDAADAVLESEKAAAIARQNALQQVNTALDNLREQNQRDNRSRRRQLLKAQNKLKSGEVPKGSTEISGSEAIEVFSDALGEIRTAQDIFREK